MSGAQELVLGLGNPGSEYEGTRHNAGAEALGRLARRLGVKLGSYRGPAWVARVRFADQELVLARPKTFMNDSGVAGARLLRELELPLSRVIVIYDELDLELGRLRIRASGGTAGHNGLRSLQAHWRSQDFPRIRIGVGRPPVGVDPIEFVLGRPLGAERDLFLAACERAAEAVLSIVRDGLEATMTEFNRRPEEPPVDVD